MLPSWRKKVHVVICPHKIIVVALGGGFRRKKISKTTLPVTPDNQSDWHPAIAVLEQWLTENDVGKASVTVQLSNCFVRYAMMPFSDGLNSHAERSAFAGLLFEDIYGEMANQWKLTLDDAHYGESCLAAAIDAGLADAIGQIAASRGLVIAAIEPCAAAIINEFGKQLQCDAGLLVIADYSQAVLVDLRGGKLSGIRKIPLALGLDEPELVSVLQREMIISGLSSETGRTYLHVAGRPIVMTPATIAAMNITMLLRENEQDNPVDCNMVYEESMR